MRKARYGAICTGAFILCSFVGTTVHLWMAGAKSSAATDSTHRFSITDTRPNTLSVQAYRSVQDAPSVSPRDGLTKIRTMNSFYGIGELNSHGFTGKGIHVAVISYEAVRIADLQAYAHWAGLPDAHVRIVPVNEGISANQVNTPEGDTEVALDVDTVHLVAPDAFIDVFEAPVTTPLSEVFQAIDNVHADSIVTVSYGILNSSTENNAEYEAVQRLNAKGVTVFASVGDALPKIVNSSDAGPSGQLVSPAILPNVVAVGGTSILYDANARRISQTHWPGSLGGYSALFPEPSYQQQVHFSSLGSTGSTSHHRMVPDISGPGDVTVMNGKKLSEGMPIIATNNQGTTWVSTRGTSMASPFMAGLFADIEQKVGHPLGDVNPLLYSEAGRVMQSVDTGSATSATEKSSEIPYNTVSGLGVPIASRLPNAIEQYDERISQASNQVAALIKEEKTNIVQLEQSGNNAHAAINQELKQLSQDMARWKKDVQVLERDKSTNHATVAKDEASVHLDESAFGRDSSMLRRQMCRLHTSLNRLTNSISKLHAVWSQYEHLHGQVLYDVRSNSIPAAADIKHLLRAARSFLPPGNGQQHS